MIEYYYLKKGDIPKILKEYGYKMHDFSMPPHCYICSKHTLQMANRKERITKSMWDRVIKYVESNQKEYKPYEWHSEFKNRGHSMW